MEEERIPATPGRPWPFKNGEREAMRRYNEAAETLWGHLYYHDKDLTIPEPKAGNFNWDGFCKLNPLAELLLRRTQKETNYELSSYQCDWALQKFIDQYNPGFYNRMYGTNFSIYTNATRFVEIPPGLNERFVEIGQFPGNSVCNLVKYFFHNYEIKTSDMMPPKAIWQPGRYYDWKEITIFPEQGKITAVKSRLDPRLHDLKFCFAENEFIRFSKDYPAYEFTIFDVHKNPRTSKPGETK